MDPDFPDPYDVLQLKRTASQAAITAAYRQLAKILHPDMPETGDGAAFIRLQQAYHVLGDPDRRAAHDHAQRSASRPAWRTTETKLGFTRALAWRWPRFAVPVLMVVTLLALVQVSGLVLRPVAPPLPATAPLAAQIQPAVLTPIPAAARPAVAPLVDFAAADHFVAPGPPIVLAGGARLEAFTPVAVPQPSGVEGKADIRTQAGGRGVVDSGRLLPGDARAARLAACQHHAGATPRAGQILRHRATGSARLEITNREDRPAVFKLRDAAGTVLATAYLAPRGRAMLENLPTGLHRAEYAQGDLWSAACGLFTAGMRAQAFAAPLDLAADGRVALPAAASTDISDDAFARD